MKRLGEIGIVPVIKIDDAQKAVPLARALIAGGIPCAEVTFRTAQGPQAIRRISDEAPEALVGAGTVLTIAQADEAIEAGARFVVSPGLNPKVVERCAERGIPVIPGCATPSEMEWAIGLGLEAVKFFPAEQAGGLEFLKAVSAAYPQLKFMPTGGINANNIARYLAFDKVIACGGSWMVAPDLIESDDFEKITKLSREAVQAALGFSLAQVVLASPVEEDALRAAGLFFEVLGLSCFEILKTAAPRRKGILTIGTNSLARALAYLQGKGFAFDMNGAEIGATGKPLSVAMKDDILGFALRLLQN
ncbi:MAG: bifunctional 4-hydroxy-2-oxoglutarate aldolase/2-dehydro-3-deoxy-phosphogluconate aldolase [Treponema sp.]|nr:bifunctional 4-hydroxy-2-oxoglutarate aldolase/2-dehydro-3-deoxy-phosphogluconate aldolase [Treponema sp.]